MKNKLLLSALAAPVALGLILTTSAHADDAMMTSTATTTAMSAPSMAMTMNGNLSFGSSGSQVTWLQNFLMSKGFLSASSTGHFGSATKEAVMKYQTSVGLGADGIVGTQTWMKITSGSAMSVTPTTSTKAADLRAVMHDILGEHVTSSLTVLRAISDNNQAALKGALAEQDANAVALSAAIGSVYGTDAQTAFLKMFRDHITDSNAYTQGVKDGNMANQQSALAALDQQLVGISSFLSTANPHIDNTTLLGALRQHEDLINQSSVAYSKGDYTNAFMIEGKAITQIGGGADYLSGAIVQQYPAKFMN